MMIMIIILIIITFYVLAFPRSHQTPPLRELGVPVVGLVRLPNPLLQE